MRAARPFASRLNGCHNSVRLHIGCLLGVLAYCAFCTASICIADGTHKN